MLSTIGRVASRRAFSALCSSSTGTMMVAACRRSTAAAVWSTRNFHASLMSMDDLPYHIVVGLPALSPTMESGSLAEWYVAEGDGVSAGDAVAKIETDKASIDFEAQDDFFIAKLLRTPGDGSDLPVGTPIMITVEDQADVAAFKDYVYKAEEAPADPLKKEKVAAPPPPASAAAEPAKQAPPAAAAAPPPPAAKAAPSPPPLPAASSSSSAGESVTIAWARPTSTTAPLTKSMIKQQDAYMKLYGTTGQKSVAAEE